MAKALSASKKVMKTYLSELLTDDPCEQPIRTNLATKTSLASTVSCGVDNKDLEALLKNVNADIQVASDNISNQNNAIDVAEATALSESETLTTQKSTNITTHKIAKNKTDKSYRQGDFQALYFDVAGLTIAVPLIELGGIHQIEKTTALMGKPDWFKGVMIHRDKKINVVDTALWVMPEKCDANMKESLNYQYIIMLKDSAWGLMAENLVDTVTLNQEQVKWSDSLSKRPWLAGLVKDKMCALLDVDSLIELLNEGSGIYQLHS